MAQNMGLFFDSREQVYGEIGTGIDSQGGDPMAVNQWVAGSSPAGGANIYAAHGRATP